ncbi:hypothetical protein L914_06902 [Phytophthora nicotianae]|uniref:Uncharacterized protein n=2 Tax=Phytophthora nicotianae TaxID=4792 RepID=V9FDU5_PHYNI|nr:hypothetical protein F443_07085 [Phytophthora nicotianae P1569]ETM48569.1 hypothetical protein L914_06902 [Phytophthora nicotianae]
MRTHRLVDEMKLCVSDLRNRSQTHTTSLRTNALLGFPALSFIGLGF